MSKIGRLWNALANPNRIPKLFSLVLAMVLLIGFIVPLSVDTDQVYPRPAPQEQVDAGLPLAPYDRGGEIFEIPGIVKAQYPENSEYLGMITSYMSPVALMIQSISPYFGTSIYSSPGGLSDELLYKVRGLDTVLESAILTMSFIIASWLAVNFTISRREDDDVRKVNSSNYNDVDKVNNSNLKRNSDLNYTQIAEEDK